MKTKTGKLKSKRRGLPQGILSQRIPPSLNVLARTAEHSNDAAIWSDLGVAYTRTDRYTEARDCFYKALTLNPKRGETYFNLGNLEVADGNLENGLQMYEQCVALLPKFSDAWLNYGNALRSKGAYSDAENAYLKAIDSDRSNVTAITNLGNLYISNSRIHSAIVCYKQSLISNPQSIPALVGLGNALCQNKQYHEARKILHAALDIDPNSAEANCNLGHTYLAEGQPDIALTYLQRATEIRPNFAEALSNIGLAKRDLGDLDGSIQSLKKAVSIRPNFTPALSNLAVTLKSAGKLNESLAIYRAAMSSSPSDPIPAYNASLLLLQLGEFDYGWKLYENRWKSPSFDSQPIRTEKPMWNGRSTSAVILVWPEQGIGDEVMFGSLFEQVYKLAPNSIFALDHRLVPIFRRSFEKLKFIEKESGISESDFDYHIPIGSLPKLFCNSIEDFEKIPKGYLFADEARKLRMRSIINAGNKKICGISWKSSNKKLGKSRSMHILDLLRLVYDPSIVYVNLQYGECENELRDAKQAQYEIFNIENLDKYNNIDDLCALISCCDIVISIDNSTVHLSGALGVQTTVLLPEDSDWRWTINRQISLWYPSLSYTT